MCDYTLIKPYKDEILQGGLNFLRRSEKASGTVKISPGDELSNLQPHKFASVRESVTVMLMEAFKDNDRFLSQIDHVEDVFSKYNQSRKRRGAVCEEDVLEKEGLLKILKAYARLTIFHEINRLF